MPVWAFVALVPVALLACPLSMWVISKVTRRKMSCAMCQVGLRGEHANTLEHLEPRKAAVDREIAQVRTELAEQDVGVRHTTVKAE